MKPSLGMDFLALPLNTGMPQPRFTSHIVRVVDRLIAVEIAFAKKSLRQLCENERRARRSLGATVAERLKRRLADLRAANCVQDLVAGRPRELAGTRAGQIAVELGDGFQLIFSANHSVPPLLDGVRLDWSKVNRVKIVSIESNYV
jgi:plasmid maintenance system killer protein